MSLRSANILRSAGLIFRCAAIRRSGTFVRLSSAFILLSRLVRGNATRARVLQERVLRDQREVAMGDPFRPG